MTPNEWYYDHIFCNKSSVVKKNNKKKNRQSGDPSTDIAYMQVQFNFNEKATDFVKVQAKLTVGEVTTDGS